MKKDSKFKIGKKEVEKIAKLARLSFNEKEIEKMEKELSKILAYVEKLKEIDVSKIEPTSHSILIKNVMRKDKAENGKSRVQNLKLLESMPQRKGNYLVVKKVIHEA